MPTECGDAAQPPPLPPRDPAPKTGRMPAIDLANPTRFLALFRPPAAVALGCDGRHARRRPLSSPSPRRPTTSRARRCGSCTSMCRSPGWRWPCYGVMAVAALGTLVWRHPLAEVLAEGRGADRRRPSPASALVTGSLWGKPMWGTYWVWDARLDLGAGPVPDLSRPHRAVAGGRTNPARRRAPRAILTLVGVINLPIIKFSVDWWNTLHQPASVLPPRRADHPPLAALAAAGDGARR